MRIKTALVKEKLEEWAALKKAVAAEEAKRDKKIAPLLEEFTAETAPIRDACAKKTAPMVATAAALEKELLALIQVDRDENDKPKPVTIATDNAVAQVEIKSGARVVDVQKYFNLIKDKSAAFWATLKVTLKDAEPIIGKEKIDEISTKPTSFAASIKLK